MNQRTSLKEYLGDSVYADFDGYHIILTTENGYPDDPRNRIALEPEVIIKLLRYRASLAARVEQEEEGQRREAVDGFEHTP